jgi:hypothetical protein
MIRECQIAAPRYTMQMDYDQPARLTGPTGAAPARMVGCPACLETRHPGAI